MISISGVEGDLGITCRRYAYHYIFGPPEQKQGGYTERITVVPRPWDTVKGFGFAHITGGSAGRAGVDCGDDKSYTHRSACVYGGAGKAFD